MFPMTPTIVDDDVDCCLISPNVPLVASHKSDSDFTNNTTSLAINDLSIKSGVSTFFTCTPIFSEDPSKSFFNGRRVTRRGFFSGLLFQ
jgi:hypothetical protein